MSEDDWVILVCPPGATDGKISHNDREFVPYREDITNPNSRWLVRTTREAARFFCWNGGFYVLEQAKG